MRRKHNVFVYGTLMQGYGNDRLWQGEDPTVLVRPAMYSGGVLLDMGGFPGMTRNPNVKHRPRRILGELLSFNNDSILDMMDVLESHPNFYKRIRQEVTLLHTPEIVDTWIYELQRGVFTYPAAKVDEDTGAYSWAATTGWAKEVYRNEPTTA